LAIVEEGEDRERLEGDEGDDGEEEEDEDEICDEGRVKEGRKNESQDLSSERLVS